MLFEEWVGDGTSISRTQPHVEAEQHEVAIVVMTHTVVEPSYTEAKERLFTQQLQWLMVEVFCLQGYDSGGPS